MLSPPTPSVSHGTMHIRQIIRLSSCARSGTCTFASVGRVTSLTHKALDISREQAVVVVSAGTECEEVLVSMSDWSQ